MLIGNIALKVRSDVRRICEENHAEIIRGRVANNHVHIFVFIPPYISVSKLVQAMKGKTSRWVQMQFPELKQRYCDKHLWVIGYFVRTSGNVTDEMIKDYIEKHGNDDKFGNFEVDT